jgi:predicted nuclease of restriction endonuclease-like (RecB) superfamily
VSSQFATVPVAIDTSDQADTTPREPDHLLRLDLSWSHYRVLMRVDKPQARRFYEAECSKARWSVRELERQIASLLYERLALSRDKEGLLALAEQGHEVRKPEDLVKDPYVLEFTGLPEAARWQESDLETTLIERLQQFLLELGRDLYFVARQKRITIDGDHFYVDLVFYHRTLRCFLLIDLKIGKLTQQDIGQMLLYTGYYEAEEMRADENPPVGLILCTDKNDAVVRYTLSQSARQIFASRYQLHLPTEEELVRELQQERALIEREQDPGAT